MAKNKRSVRGQVRRRELNKRDAARERRVDFPGFDEDMFKKITTTQSRPPWGTQEFDPVRLSYYPGLFGRRRPVSPEQRVMDNPLPPLKVLPPVETFLREYWLDSQRKYPYGSRRRK